MAYWRDSLVFFLYHRGLGSFLVFLGPPHRFGHPWLTPQPPVLSKIGWAASLEHIIKSYHTKFRCNRTNGCWARALKNFGNQSCILKLCGRYNLIIVWMVWRLYIKSYRLLQSVKNIIWSACFNVYYCTLHPEQTLPLDYSPQHNNYTFYCHHNNFLCWAEQRTTKTS